MAASCDNFHASDNGRLDGFWQLTSVDSLHNGHSADMHKSGIYWAVQANLLEVRDTKFVHVDVFFRFIHDGDNLTLYDPVADNRIISDSVVTDPSTLYFYGLSHLTETVKVLQLTKTKMTLQSERLRMYFRKY